MPCLSALGTPSPGRVPRRRFRLDKNSTVLYDIAMNSTPAPVRFEDDVLRSVGYAGRVIEARFDETLAAHDLSLAKLGVLRLLAHAQEPVSLGQLAQRLACVKSNVTQLIDRLEDDGLVQRLPGAGDRRSVRACITEKGRQSYEQGLSARHELARRLLANLSIEEQGQLDALLARLLSRP